MSTTNGTAPAAKNGMKTTVEIKPAEKPTTGLVVIPKKVDASDLPPLEERLHRINQIFEIQVKYNRLQSSLTKLQSFKLEQQGERNKLSLLDESRNEFATNNPEIIAEVTDFLTIKIKEKIKALEPLLKW